MRCKQNLNYLDCLTAVQNGYYAHPWRLAHRKQLDSALNLYNKELYGHFGCVNVMEFSPDNILLASGGDDRRVLLWKVGSFLRNHNRPHYVLPTQHLSNIFCLRFEHSMNHLLSGGNDECVIRHDIERSSYTKIFAHDEPVYGISLPFNDSHVFATASENGTVQLWDIRCQEKTLCLALSSGSYHSCEFNPMDPALVAAANSQTGAELYDVRCPYRPLLRYGLKGKKQNSMYVTFNNDGTKVLTMFRKTGPVLYNTQSHLPIYEFNHSGYKNACTMKSTCFGGDNDQLVVAGSDDSGVYVWNIPEEDSQVTTTVEHTKMILRRHRSIVNQVRYNKVWKVFASAGVEKSIKIWSQFPMHDCRGNLLDATNENQSNLSLDDILDESMGDSMPLDHNYDDENTDEDPRMIAFFDALNQRVHENFIQEDTSDEESDDEYVHELFPTEEVEANVLDIRRIFRR